MADGPNRLWLTDITEHPTHEGKVYLAAVLDVYGRRVFGWSIADHLRAELVVDALEMARWRRRPAPGQTVLHSDRGTQYASWTFGHRLRAAGLLGSMGRVGSAYDNAMMESFFSTLQRELLDRRSWSTRRELASANRQPQPRRVRTAVQRSGRRGMIVKKQAVRETGVGSVAPSSVYSSTTTPGLATTVVTTRAEIIDGPVRPVPNLVC